MRQQHKPKAAEPRQCDTARRPWSAGEMRLAGWNSGDFMRRRFCSFMRQLRSKGWRIAQASHYHACRKQQAECCEACGTTRRLRCIIDEDWTNNGQRTLCVFSSRILARHASAAGRRLHAAHAEVGFPLATDPAPGGTPARLRQRDQRRRIARSLRAFRDAMIQALRLPPSMLRMAGGWTQGRPWPARPS